MREGRSGQDGAGGAGAAAAGAVRRAGFAGWWVVLVGAALYLPFLGARELWYPDEPDLAQVTRAMVDSGDWIVPRQNGAVWVDYPPLLYWTGALSAAVLGGFSSFALRLPSALAAILLAVLVAGAARRAAGPLAGILAGVILLTFEQTAMQAPSYRPDVLFALFVGGGLLVYARGLGPPARWGPRVLSFALLGLAVLTKGPLGLLLPGLVLVLWHALRREGGALLALAPLSLVALAVALPWYLACGSRVGWDVFGAELHAQNLARFGDDLRGHGRPIHYYLVHLWLNLAILAPLLPVAVFRALRAGPGRPPDAPLWLLWSGAMFVFFSLAVTKRELYLLPAYPAAALLLGTWLAGAVGEGAAAGDRRAARAYATGLVVALGGVGLLALAAPVALPALGARLDLDATSRGVLEATAPFVVAFGALAIAAAVWIGRALGRGDLRATFLRILAFQVPVIALLYGGVLPAMEPAKSYAPAARWVVERAPGATHLGLVDPGLGHHKMGAFGYHTGQAVVLLGDRAAVERFLIEHPRSLVLVHAPDAASVLGPGVGRVLGTVEAGRRRFVALAAPAAEPPGPEDPGTR